MATSRRSICTHTAMGKRSLYTTTAATRRSAHAAMAIRRSTWAMKAKSNRRSQVMMATNRMSTRNSAATSKTRKIMARRTARLSAKRTTQRVTRPTVDRRSESWPVLERSRPRRIVVDHRARGRCKDKVIAGTWLERGRIDRAQCQEINSGSGRGAAYDDNIIQIMASTAQWARRGIAL